MNRVTPRINRRWGWDLSLAGLLVVTPLSIELWAPHRGLLMRLPLVDVGLWTLVAVLMVTGRVRMGSLRALPTAFVAATGLSVGASLIMLSGTVSIPSCIQRADYVILVAILALGLPSAVWTRGLVGTLPIVTMIFLLVAFAQMVLAHRPPWLVHSLFEDQHLFGTWTSLVAASVLARVPGRSREWALGLVLLAFTGLTATTILPWVGVACGITAALCDNECSKEDRARWLVAVLAVASVAVLLAPASQRRSIAEAWRVFDVATREELHARGAQIDAMHERTVLFVLPGSVGGMALVTPNLHPLSPVKADPRREAVFTPGYVDQRFLEAQAALQAVSASPIFGWGLGSYQRQTTANYFDFRKLKTLRPDSQCGWLVEMVQTGLAGVLILLWLLVGILASTRRSQWTGLPGQRLPLQASIVTALLLAVAVPLFDTPMMSLLTLLCATARRTGAHVSR